MKRSFPLHFLPKFSLPVLPSLLLVACNGRQSVLAPAGVDAAQLLHLFWIMLAGAVLVWIGIIGLYVYVLLIRPGKLSRRAAHGVIIGGGIVLPLVVLLALVSYGLSIMPAQSAGGDGLRIRVTGERWWWRVEYFAPGSDSPVVAANEVRLPAGQRTEIELAAAKVIHAFWIPALGGKTDMIPGRINTMSLEPTRPGVYRGQCTEFCGLSHALMAFEAVVMEPAAFNTWLEQERQSLNPAPDAPARGREVFLAQGCGACHSVRGTAASGAVGPDLTHLGGRRSLAAGALPMTRAALQRWLRDPGAVKPGAEMPAYDHLPEADLEALAAWLEGLQ